MISPAANRRLGHAIVIVGAIVLVLGLLAIYLDIERAHAEIIRGFFTTNPRTGFVIEARGDWNYFVFDLPDGAARLGSHAALAGVVIVAWGARRLGREQGIRLGLVLGPVLAVVALGLLAGLLVHYRYQGELRDAFMALGGRPEGPNSCVVWLTPCSRVQAIDRLWEVVVPLLCVVSVVAFLLAAPRAWRAGALRGLLLPSGWACASVALFVVGSISLVATMPHARDIRRVAGQCVQHPVWEQRNMTSPSVQGMVVDRCAVGPSDVHPMVEPTVAFAVADAEGGVSSPFRAGGDEPRDLTAEEFSGYVGESIDDFEAVAEFRRAQLPRERVLALYVDKRSSPLVLREHLRLAREAGITDLLLYGQALIEGSLATQGEWTRRTLCPAGWVHFEDRTELGLGDFVSWAELQRAAIERGAEPLTLHIP